jgi:hypothetical protein
MLPIKRLALSPHSRRGSKSSLDGNEVSFFYVGVSARDMAVRNI